MSTLMKAADAAVTARTENGMAAYNTSGEYCLDLFGKIGSARKTDLSGLFLKAYKENSDLAARILLWARDCRGGAGERGTFRALLGVLIRNDVAVAERLLARTPELGRWDDVLIALNTPLEDKAVAMVKSALESGDGLCAKWMPRKGAEAARLRYKLGYTPKFYRKRLVELTNVVETLMCAKQWDKIEFAHVPSVAQNRYSKAFTKNAGARYAKYIEKVEKGEAKINQSASFPHDVIRTLRNGNARAAEAMWQSLPDYLDGVDERILPMVDMSGSMTWESARLSGEIFAIDVAAGLGIYFAQRNKSIFHNEVITFSTRPAFLTLGKGLQDSYNILQRGDNCGSTNIEAAIKMILTAALKGTVAESEMPTKILIMTDMQFNECAASPGDTALQMIRREYEASGYKMPNVVFWNLCGRETSMPVKVSDKNTAIMSGFSPATVKAVLGADIDPVTVMLTAVGSSRYDY